ncbi:aggregation-promoting factor [Furfurilactobacillus entadae]|uniref:aggregation-promoting factor n=1 Tax=Furfurilactobacillus entadae TaxID=2922307 RepID=UPI0035E796C3
MKIKQLLLSTVSAGALLAVGTIAANADTNVTVKSGDTVSELAQANNTTIDAIVSANALTNGGNLIYVGQTLTLPDGTSTATASQAPVQASVASQAPASQATSLVASQASVASQAPAASQAPVAVSQAASQAPVASQAPAQTVTTQAVATTTTSSASTTTVSSSSDDAAKAYIAAGESGGSYTATNGQYIGKYQLSADKLNGDYSAANQEAVASQYAIARYGSWSAAASYWAAHHAW